MREADVKRLVFSSTAAVYGEPEEVPVTESATPLPTNPYGAPKLAADHLIGYAAAAQGLAAVSLRYFNVAGASGRFGNADASSTQLIPVVLRVAAGRRDAVEVFGTDYPTRDGTAARLHPRRGPRARPPSGARGSPGGRAKDLQSRQRRVLHGCRGYTGGPPDYGEAHRRCGVAQASGDPAVVVASAQKIRSELGWKPKKPDLETMISDAWDWIKVHSHEYEPGSMGD
jgi:UDP-glucose 4-epimerase